MKMKKIAVLLLTVCLMVSNFTMLTQAADGKIMFTDPSTAVGETLELKGVVTSETDIEDRKVVMTYDTTMLKFKEGNNVTETADGKLTYEVSGKKDGNRVEFLMYFDVLKEGTTKVEVESYTAWDSSDDKIDCVKGSSTITIAEGELQTVIPEEPSVLTVDVNGTAYTLSSDFEETLIPAGYEVSNMEYDGSQCKVVVNPITGATLVYLLNEAGEGGFFLYDLDKDSFEEYQLIKISDKTSIVLLSNVEEITLPDTYLKTVVVVNGNEFPVWQDAEETSRCILYALNNNGEKALYQYDSIEGTYQRFNIPGTQEEPTDSTMFGKISGFLEEHIDYVVLGTGLGFILFILIIIILSVKLYNRNAELDELYDEYGIGEEDDENDDKDDEEELEDSEKLIVNLDEEDSEVFFTNIEEEIEEDIVMEDVFEEEIKVEFFEQTKEALLKRESVRTETSILKEEEYFDEEDDIDFEMDFIDLDD